MLVQYKDEILVDYSSFASLAAAQTAINDAISSNPGYCLIDDMQPQGQRFFILAEDWGVSNPIHEVVFVEVTEPIDEQLPGALAANPGYNFIEFCFLPAVPTLPVNILILGRS